MRAALPYLFVHFSLCCLVSGRKEELLRSALPPENTAALLMVSRLALYKHTQHLFGAARMGGYVLTRSERPTDISSACCMVWHHA